MADSQVSFKRGNKINLQNLEKADGSLIVTTDSHELFFDNGQERFQIGNDNYLTAPNLKTLVNWNQIDPNEQKSVNDIEKVETWSIFKNGQTKVQYDYEILEDQIKGYLPPKVWYEVKSSLIHIGENNTPLGFFKGCNFIKQPSPDITEVAFEENDSFTFHISRSYPLEEGEVLYFCIIGLENVRGPKSTLPLIVKMKKYPTGGGSTIPDEQGFVDFDKVFSSDDYPGDGLNGWVTLKRENFIFWDIQAGIENSTGNPGAPAAEQLDLSSIFYINICGNTKERFSSPGDGQHYPTMLETSFGNIMFQKDKQILPKPAPTIFSHKIKGNTTGKKTLISAFKDQINLGSSKEVQEVFTKQQILQKDKIYLIGMTINISHHESITHFYYFGELSESSSTYTKKKVSMIIPARITQSNGRSNAQMFMLYQPNKTNLYDITISVQQFFPEGSPITGTTGTALIEIVEL